MKMRSEKRALDKIYKRRDRYDIPDWQREEVWSVEKQQQLIDSILRGWKLPKFYFQKTQDEPEEFEVVDGQQRLNAIWSFFEGELRLKKEQATEFGGATYSELPDPISDSFDDYEIEYDEITDASDEDVKEFFQRLQEGVRLTSSEKLNSVHSKLRDYCSTTAKKPFFVQTISASNKRYAHFDIVTKVMAIELEGLDAGLRYKDVKQVFDQNANFSPTSAAAKRMNAALDYLHKSFPVGSNLFRNRTVVQSLISLVCHLQAAGVTNLKQTKLAEFITWFLTELRNEIELGQNATDQDFLVFQRTVNANVKSGARIRQSILLRKLFQKHPQFFGDLAKSPALHEIVIADCVSLAKDIRDTIKLCNDRYSSKHGKDLFKATNKTATALASLSDPISSLEEFKSFVEGLYTVFRESIGQRLDGQIPSSFKDVNDFRTYFEHDLDHGKSAKVGKQQKAIGQRFLHYAGVTSPDAVPGANFVLTQANMLKALSSDLKILAKLFV